MENRTDFVHGIALTLSLTGGYISGSKIFLAPIPFRWGLRSHEIAFWFGERSSWPQTSRRKGSRQTAHNEKMRKPASWNLPSPVSGSIKQASALFISSLWKYHLMPYQLRFSDSFPLCWKSALPMWTASSISSYLFPIGSFDFHLTYDFDLIDCLAFVVLVYHSSAVSH